MNALSNAAHPLKEEIMKRQIIRVEPLSRYALERRAPAGLVIGYGRVHETALEPAVEALARVITR